MERIPVSIYKLLNPTRRLEDVARLDGLATREVTEGEGGFPAEIRLGRTVATSAPAWLIQLGRQFQIPEATLNQFISSSVSGLYWTRIRDSAFVLSFGHAWLRIKLSEVEQNFGLRCVLNICESNALRAIKRDRITSDYVQAMEQSPEDTDIHRFAVDTETDLLKGVKATAPSALGLGSSIAGSDSFRCVWTPQTTPVATLLELIDRLSKGSEYQKGFPWIDDIKPVRDEHLINTLDASLASEIKAGSAGISLCVPDFDQWDSYDDFVFGRFTTRASHTDLTLEAWLHYVRGRGDEISAAYLMDQKIHALDTANPGRNTSWCVRDCIHGSLLGSRHIIHGGSWYEISSRFSEKITRQLSRIAIGGSFLPRSGHREHEYAFNKRVARRSNRELQLFDRKLIRHGGKYSSIEFCDLLSKDMKIICVKRWSSSAGISHLCRQALNTCRLVRSDEEFCNKISRRLKGFRRATWMKIQNRNQRAEVILAIMGLRRLEDLPFFSRITIADSVKKLQQLGFDVAFAPV